jgi:hypothetical protein
MALCCGLGDESIWVVCGGGRFAVSDAQSALGLTADLARDVPTGTLAQVSGAPADFARFQDAGSGDQFVILNGARILIDENVRTALAVAGHDADVPYVLPTAVIEQLPVAQVRRGDADCSGEIGRATIDILQSAAACRRPACAPSPATWTATGLRHERWPDDPLPDRSEPG